MAAPKAHVIASVGLLAVMCVIGFYIGFTMDLMDIVWLVVFGVLVDIDHIPVGRLREAFKVAGLAGVMKSWREHGWFDADHVDFLHTWWALAAVIVFSLFVGNMPFIAYGVHMLIDSATLVQLDYPKCAPLPGWILRHFGLRFYPKWVFYYTEGVPRAKGNRGE